METKIDFNTAICYLFRKQFSNNLNPGIILVNNIEHKYSNYIEKNIPIYTLNKDDSINYNTMRQRSLQQITELNKFIKSKIKYYEDKLENKLNIKFYNYLNFYNHLLLICSLNYSLKEHALYTKYTKRYTNNIENKYTKEI